MYLLNYPILMYVIIQEKSPANETELQFIVDIKLAPFISSVNHETDTRLCTKPGQHRAHFSENFHVFRPISWFRKERAISHSCLEAQGCGVRSLYLE